jgi:hypothetical protein
MNLDKRIAAVSAIRDLLCARVAALPHDAYGDDVDALERAIGQVDRMLDACPVGGALHAYIRSTP